MVFDCLEFRVIRQSRLQEHGLGDDCLKISETLRIADAGELILNPGLLFLESLLNVRIRIAAIFKSSVIVS